jgi:hypothetical protein
VDIVSASRAESFHDLRDFAAASCNIVVMVEFSAPVMELLKRGRSGLVASTHWVAPLGAVVTAVTSPRPGDSRPPPSSHTHDSRRRELERRGPLPTLPDGVPSRDWESGLDSENDGGETAQQRSER